MRGDIHPRVWPDVVTIPEHVLTWARGKFAYHREECGFDEGLTIQGCFAGCDHAVDMHTDSEEATGRYIWGLILEGEHELVVADYNKVNVIARLPLRPGTIYRLHPHIMHGTEGEGQIMFAVTGVEVDAHHDPAIVAEVLLSLMDDEITYDRNTVEREAAELAAMGEGVQPVALETA